MCSVIGTVKIELSILWLILAVALSWVWWAREPQTSTVTLLLEVAKVSVTRGCPKSRIYHRQIWGSQA